MRSGIRNLFGRNVTSAQGDVTKKVTPQTRYISHNLGFYMKCNFVTSKIKGIRARQTIVYVCACMCARIFANLYISRLQGYKGQKSYKEADCG